MRDVGVIDSHLHLWDLSVSDYSWLGPQHGELFASFTADDARRALDSAGVGSAILVQAEDSLRDTEFLLATAEANEWIVGVIGWVPLDDPAAAEQALDRWQRHPAFCGVRHLIHEDPRDDFLALPAVRTSLALLAARGVAFDVADAWPRHLVRAGKLAAAFPDLRVVIDHLAKPPIGRADYGQWEEALRHVARNENAVAKFSGLRMPGVPFTVGTLRPVWDIALELFGPARLMYGGDWPITVPHGGYLPTWEVMSELIGELSPPERADVLAGTAKATYRLDEGRGGLCL